MNTTVSPLLQPVISNHHDVDEATVLSTASTVLAQNRTKTMLTKQDVSRILSHVCSAVPREFRMGILENLLQNARQGKESFHVAYSTLLCLSPECLAYRSDEFQLKDVREVLEDLVARAQKVQADPPSNVAVAATSSSDADVSIMTEDSNLMELETSQAKGKKDSESVSMTDKSPEVSTASKMSVDKSGEK